MSNIDALVARLDVKPTVHLPDMGAGTVNVAASIRQLMVERSEAAIMIRALREALRDAARADRSAVYDYGEARAFDGVPPKTGSCWLTPREIARKALGEPDLATVSEALGISAPRAEGGH